MKKPKFRIGAKIKVISPYGYTIGKGKVKEIRSFLRPTPFSESKLKYYYYIPELGLIAEDLISKGGK